MELAATDWHDGETWPTVLCSRCRGPGTRLSELHVTPHQRRAASTRTSRPESEGDVRAGAGRQPLPGRLVLTFSPAASTLPAPIKGSSSAGMDGTGERLQQNGRGRKIQPGLGRRRLDEACEGERIMQRFMTSGSRRDEGCCGLSW